MLKFNKLDNPADRDERTVLERANNLLFSKQFKDCLELSLRSIADLKSEPENIRYLKCA